MPSLRAVPQRQPDFAITVTSLLVLKSAKTVIEDVAMRGTTASQIAIRSNRKPICFWGFHTPNKRSDLRENNDSEPDARSRRLWPIPSVICPGLRFMLGRWLSA